MGNKQSKQAQRRATADQDQARKPTAARLAKGDLVEATERGPDLAQVTHYRARDTVAILAGHGSLTRREVMAAMVVRDLAERAALQSVVAQDLMRARSVGLPGGRVPLTDAQLQASGQLRALAVRFGGLQSLGGSLLVRVLGEGASLAAWVQEQGVRSGRRSLTPRHAAGALIMVLGVVAQQLDELQLWGHRMPRDGDQAAQESDATAS